MPPQAHDALFKAAFEDPANVSALYQRVYPPELCERVDWNSVRPEAASFVDEALGKRHSDLLFAAEVRDTREPVYLYLLLEHLSTPVPSIPLQVFVYLARIYERHHKRHGLPLPHVLPLIVTHAGGNDFASIVPPNFASLFAPPPSELPGLTELTPQFRLAVLDLSAMTNPQLKQLALVEFAKLALWLLRDGRDWPRLRTNLSQWIPAFGRALRTPSGVESVARLLRYVAETNKGVQYQQFRATLARQLPETERVMITYAEELRQEGRIEGRVEGQLNLLERLLTRKFGPLPPQAHQTLANASEAELLDYAERMLTATTLESLLSPTNPRHGE
jgi:predicted transposase/invertase (TIGR01784 family)